MPFRTTRTHQPVYNVLRDTHFLVGDSRLFDNSYIAANAYQEKYLYPGLIVALSSVNSQYVPYSAAASYGTGSDTAVGVLAFVEDVTYGKKAIAPVFHGTLLEDYCFVYGGALGTVPAAVKTALQQIHWV